MDERIHFDHSPIMSLISENTYVQVVVVHRYVEQVESHTIQDVEPMATVDWVDSARIALLIYLKMVQESSLS